MKEENDSKIDNQAKDQRNDTMILSPKTVIEAIEGLPLYYIRVVITGLTTVLSIETIEMKANKNTRLESWTNADILCCYSLCYDDRKPDA